jgi:hypothetical protein
VTDFSSSGTNFANDRIRRPFALHFALQTRRGRRKVGPMDSEPSFAPYLDDRRNGRTHRFMESADVNAAFRELFDPLRANIRRGLSNHGQVYAIEMDACIPGEVLGSAWIPPATRGYADGADLADGRRRRTLYAQLFAERRAESLLAYVCERPTGVRRAVLYVEVASVDGVWAAKFPVRAGRGWHHRELLPAASKRVGDGVAPAV